MLKRLALRQAAQLAQVQRVRMAASEASLIAARDAEADARSARQCAEDDAHAAQRQWFGHVSTGAFEPERSCDLAANLIVREREADTAKTVFQDAAEAHLRRQGQWRLAAARVELADTALETTRRAAARARDERRQADMSDRITFVWTKP